MLMYLIKRKIGVVEIYYTMYFGGSRGKSSLRIDILIMSLEENSLSKSYFSNPFTVMSLTIFIGFLWAYGPLHSGLLIHYLL